MTARQQETIGPRALGCPLNAASRMREPAFRKTRKSPLAFEDSVGDVVGGAPVQLAVVWEPRRYYEW